MALCYKLLNPASVRQPRQLLRFVGKRPLWTQLSHVPYQITIRRTYSQNRNSNDSKKNSKQSKTKRILARVGLSLLIPYTCYAVFVSLSAFREIDIRNDLLDDVEKGSETTYAGTLLKYSPLQVLGRYENPFAEYRIQTVYEFFFNRVVELFESNRGGVPKDPEVMAELMPVHKPEWPDKISQTTDNLIDFRVIHKETPEFSTFDPSTVEGKPPIPIYNTWLGQSCNYVIYNGIKILTDPIFGEYLLGDSFGPKRITGIPADIKDVPVPDIILVSHNHPDHLDKVSLRQWADSNALWIVPKGMGKFMRGHEVKNVIELSWWDRCELKKDGHHYDVACTPAMHWSGRYIYDTNQSLWCTFMFRHNRQPIMFHGGDTGYVNDLFKRIGQIYGEGVKLAILPCGQYCPEWHQRPRHINPAEVIRIMDDLSAQNVLGVHWGTFLLSGEHFLEPKQKLEGIADVKGISKHCFCPELGKTIRFD